MLAVRKEVTNMNRTEARAQWEQMTGEAQAEALRKMCIYCRKYAAGKGQFWAAWIRTEDDLQTASAEAWIEMEMRQADSGANAEQRNFRNQVDKTKPHWYMNIEHKTKQGGTENEKMGD